MKTKFIEAHSKKSNASLDSNRVSNIVLAKESYQNDYNKDCESRNDSSSELDDIIATKHGSSSDNATGQLQLGLTLTALNEMVGKIIEVT